ncbi:MAG: DUF4175 family protein [Gemmataceae bacterium]|nr:DUF4175 family protein [Gemmataceae bacterium]
MKTASRLSFLAGSLFLFGFVYFSTTHERGTVHAAVPDEHESDLVLQQERQKQIQAETDVVVRRLGTMLRVLDYYEVDKSAEKKLLEEMSGVLAGLSRNQMAEVIRRLDLAVKTPEEEKSNEELVKAYDRHREILDTLKSMLAKHDAVRSLDQAAERMDKLAKSQLELHLQTQQFIKDSIDRSDPNLAYTRRLALAKSLRNLNMETKRQGDEQAGVQIDADSLMKQVRDLSAKLPEEQKDRVVLMDKVAAQRRLRESLTTAVDKLKGGAAGAQKFEQWAAANELQFKSATTLQELARVLRAPSDLLGVLREARERVDQAIAKQEDIHKETKAAEGDAKEPERKDEPGAKNPPKNPDALKFPDLTPLTLKAKQPTERISRFADIDQAAQKAQAAEKTAELGKQQTRLQYDTKDTSNLLKPAAKDLAQKLEGAEKAMDAAKDALAKNLPKQATEPQQKAVNTLQDVRKELDKLIAAAEKEKTDPLAAMKKAIDDLEKLLKDQTTTRDETKETMADKQNAKLAELAREQKDLALRAEMLKETPLPSKDKTEPALDKATKAMDKATEALKKKKSADAVPEQNKAIDALKEAQKEMADKLAEMEQRRKDLAKLEEAAKKLDELAKAEKNLADKASDMAKDAKPQSKDLAKEQDKLTPPTKELAKELNQAAPKAAQKVADSAKNMDAAKKELAENKTKQGAKEATEAAQKLVEAQKELAKAMDELKAKDIADQTAMQPNKLDPEAAAQQIAKALEQTQKAAQEAKQADKLAKNQMQKAQPDLAKLQEQIAKDAQKMQLAEAAKDAAKAADALKESDFKKALGEQQKALGKLQEAAQKPKQADQAKTSELAKAQKDLMDATKAAMASQEATKAAMAALAQAQAQAPQAVQKPLQSAGQKLGDASQKLQQGQPGQAGQKQEQAAQDLSKALDALNAALAAANQPQVQPGQPTLAKAQPMGQPGQPGEQPGQQPGQDGKDGQGEGKQPGQGQPKQPGQGKGKQPGPAQEKNEQPGTGDRQPDGKVANARSQSNGMDGDGSFLHLPPRQRELIRQALSATLPPEYAGLIQQYYINIARGRPAAGNTPGATLPKR